MFNVGFLIFSAKEEVFERFFCVYQCFFFFFFILEKQEIICISTPYSRTIIIITSISPVYHTL